MQGKLKKLKDNNGQYVFPVTRGEGVFVEDGKTLTQKLLEMETGSGGGEVVNTSSLYPYYQPTEEDGALSPTNRVYLNWTAPELYQAWDNLMSQHPKYIKRDIAAYKDMSGLYELRRYILEPEFGYEKTIYIGAGAHGTEWAGKLSILRIAQIICEKWETNPQLSYMRNKVRMVIIPIVNPWGHDNKTLINSNASANTGGKGVNLNRNHDSMRFNTVMSVGGDHNGAYPFSETETQWVRDTIEWIDPKNIHYAFDFHDAPTQAQFGDYWINLDTFHETSKREIKKLTWYLADKNYADPYIWHDHDTTNSGTLAVWMNKTMGVPASTVEHAYTLGQSGNFNATFMTLSVEVYLNALIVLTITEQEHPVISSDKTFFNLDWYKAGTDFAFWNPTSYESVIELWDKLVADNPSYASKSENSFTDSAGKPVHYYTFSPKRYKKTIVLVGGRSNPNKGYLHFGIALHKFANLLCDYGKDYDFLSELRSEVRIIIIPFLEWSAYYLNFIGNFTADGTPNLTKIPVSNIVSILDEIGTINGVLYSQELNLTDTEASPLSEVFVLPSQDVNDDINIESYVDHLASRGLTPSFNRTATAEFANYVYMVKNAPCVRVDTGLDQVKFPLHKSDFVDVNGVITIPTDHYLKLNHEISRRINNMVNVAKLMIEKP